MKNPWKLNHRIQGRELEYLGREKDQVRGSAGGSGGGSVGGRSSEEQGYLLYRYISFHITA